MYKHLLSICCFNKICPTMQCKHRRNLIGKKERLSGTWWRLERYCSDSSGTTKANKSTGLPLNHVWNRWQKAVHSFGKHLCSFLKEVDLKNTKKKDTEGSLGFGRQVTDCGSVNSAPIMTGTSGGRSNTWAKQLRCLSWHFPLLQLSTLSHTDKLLAADRYASWILLNDSSKGTGSSSHTSTGQSWGSWC